MFRAIFRKEWRQLRLLRWATIAIAAILPAAFLAGAELARRGTSPFGELRDYSNAELFGELLPAVVAFGLWPLAALLLGSQAWVGDRAAGTESFLLERPVGRGTVWIARLAAASASLGSTIAGSSALVCAVGLAWGGGLPSEGWRLALAGTIVAVLALAGVAGASAFVTSPIPALLLGLLFAAFPALLAGGLAAAFPYATIARMPVGAIVPWLLIPGFVAASVAGLCRGEPAGRGRVRRASAVIGIGAVLTAAAFLAGAPAAIANATSFHRGFFYTEVSPAGRTAVLRRGEWDRMGLSIVDLGSGATVASFAPPSREVIWHPDGNRLAVVNAAGPFGSRASRPRVEFLETNGRPFAPPVDIDPVDMVGAVWSEERLVFMTHHVEGGASARAHVCEILVVEPAAGRTDVVPFARGVRQCGLVGPTSAGALAVAVEDDGNNSRNVVASARWRAHRLDAMGRPEREPVAAGNGYPILWSGLIVSPSGRYFLLAAEEAGTRGHVLFDNVRGAPLAPSGVPGGLRRWVVGDGQVVVARRDDATKLFLLPPEGPGRVLRQWAGARQLLAVEVSPDHRRVLVIAVPPKGTGPQPTSPAPPDEIWSLPSETHGTEFETAIFDVETGRWSVLDSALNATGLYGSVTWAGPSALVRSAPGYLEVVELGGAGSRRVLFGKEPSISR